MPASVFVKSATGALDFVAVCVTMGHMESKAQPMMSARMHAGLYEVLGTSTGCVIERCENGRWALDSDGEFVASFDTKREALQYCQEHPEL